LLGFSGLLPQAADLVGWSRFRSGSPVGLPAWQLTGPPEEDTRDMNRERAETHLRLLAEAELRGVMKMPVGSVPGRGVPPGSHWPRRR
jgi:hypothetical protein